ncbi:glycosyltransferase [Phytohabitans sp. ZYX-F-186]|uniref:Glycosyltransferase n=1 Tax=Phytohabitans maris TaxID=3071409 RepID=A0ABU0ZAV9_9ACTN|nr:glycosyltransferase [Phytohabitans sp. ZYX-F-186]MDQ7904201.1 glycosyltransferase [Phytohabitans sp. ZYX-F-186]
MISIVVPTVGRPSLAVLLDRLAPSTAEGAEILVVDDRPGRSSSPGLPVRDGAYPKMLAGRGRGPAAARNTGWRAARFPWVAFLDDDVVPDPDWFARLRADLDVPARVGGVQGRIRVPLPRDRPPTDWERATAGLEEARWITADMAYRRTALAGVGGFDERFPRAYREDAELAYRVRCAGWELVRGARRVTHPVRPEGPWVSLRAQRGNADDALLRRLYGPRWRARVEGLPGRRPRHAVITAALVVAATVPRLRMVAGAAWLAGTAEFAAARIKPGPKAPREIAAALLTSVLIPPLATVHWLRGWWRWRGARPLGGGSS